MNQDKLLNPQDSVVNSRPISLTWRENRLFGLIFLFILINAYLHKLPRMRYPYPHITI